MRTKTLLTTAAAGTFLVLTLSTGSAMADPTDGSTDSPGGAAEPGVVSVSPSDAATGSSVRISGTCPTAADGAGDPSVQSVTSDAFTGPESFSKTDPTAFDGTATIAHGAAAGDHSVLLTCSNGTASTTVTVTGGSTPDPAPSGNGSGGNGSGNGANGNGSSGGTEGTGGDSGALPASEGGAGAEMSTNAGAGSGDGASVVDGSSDSGAPWGWITAGGIVVIGAAAGATYALTRRRGAGAGTPARHTGD
jgi:hypothetical protein